MYILINNKTYNVEYVSEKQVANYSKNLILAEVESLPEKYDCLTAENIREVTETWTEIQEVENQDAVIEQVEIEKSRTYNTCDLIANFKTAKTEKQIASEQEKKYQTLCVKYIRHLYTANDESKIIREYLADMSNADKKVQFDKYNQDVESCKSKAKQEIYG